MPGREVEFEHAGRRYVATLTSRGSVTVSLLDEEGTTPVLVGEWDASTGRLRTWGKAELVVPDAWVTPMLANATSAALNDERWAAIRPSEPPKPPRRR
jgi:hypothetical protein